MKIFFLRHAEAEEGADDAARELTPRGWEQAKAVGMFLAKQEVEFDAAFTSPLVRAVQTAEGVLKQFNKKNRPELKQTDLLLNSAANKKFDAWLRELVAYDRLLLVGHNPSLSEHLARLLGLSFAGPTNLSKGALALVKYLPPPQAELKMLINPKNTGLFKEP